MDLLILVKFFSTAILFPIMASHKINESKKSQGCFLIYAEKEFLKDKSLMLARLHQTLPLSFTKCPLVGRSYYFPNGLANPTDSNHCYDIVKSFNDIVKSFMISVMFTRELLKFILELAINCSLSDKDN